jgi:RNA polymerase sigma-70 factor, ECF subfamily
MSQFPIDFNAGHSELEASADDTGLLVAVAAGDQAAFTRLYDRYSRPLYSIAHRILDDAAEAEDIVHDVFVSIWGQAGRFRAERGSAFGWLVALTRNRAIDRLRRRRRRREILDQSAPSDLPQGQNRNEALDSSADLWLKEKATVVRQAISTLSTEQRTALELAYFGGFTQDEIATQLQEPLGTVKARIRRALLKLRDTLASRL